MSILPRPSVGRSRPGKRFHGSHHPGQSSTLLRQLTVFCFADLYSSRQDFLWIILLTISLPEDRWKIIEPCQHIAEFNGVNFGVKLQGLQIIALKKLSVSTAKKKKKKILRWPHKLNENIPWLRQKFEPRTSGSGQHFLELAQTQMPKMIDFSTDRNVNIWTPDFAVFISLKKRF